MLHVITTTHAIPQRIPTGRWSVRTSTLILCPYCQAALGHAVNHAQRIGLATGHKCTEKTVLCQPAISVPFS